MDGIAARQRFLARGDWRHWFPGHLGSHTHSVRAIANDLDTTETATYDTTEALVHAASAGDLVACERLIDRYGRMVQATVRRFRLRDADAQDAVQNTWLAMIEHIASLRDSSRLPGWLAMTARRECLKILRRARRESIGLPSDVVNHADDPAPGPERATVDRAMNDLLWKHVGELPSRGRDLLTTLMAPNPPAYAELARSTGMPIGSIGPMRMRYLCRLRRQLETAGLGAHEWS
jgi:RNA polymerase sigma factor (sigma-70 family)